MSYASVDDVSTLWRSLTAEEQSRAAELLPLISDLLDQAAANVGKDLETMTSKSSALASTAKVVTVDVVSRVLRQSTAGEPVAQESQSAMGYSWQGTYAVPGGGIANAIMDRDLKRLGLAKQKIGVVELYGNHRRNDPASE